MSILRRRWARAIVAAALSAGAWMLFVYAADLPTSQRVGYGCAICRANKTTDSLFLIPMWTRVEGNEFSRYYREHVDAAHKHVWLFGSVARERRSGGISAHGSNGPFRLYYEPAFSILQSLPDRRTRRAFCEMLYRAYEAHEVTPEGQAAWRRVCLAIYKLNGAYWDDEHRRDWPEQLKKVGLYPGVPKLGTND